MLTGRLPGQRSQRPGPGTVIGPAGSGSHWQARHAGRWRHTPAAQPAGGAAEPGLSPAYCERAHTLTPYYTAGPAGGPPVLRLRRAAVLPCPATPLNCHGHDSESLAPTVPLSDTD